jgi:hypothetical protein
MSEPTVVASDMRTEVEDFLALLSMRVLQLLPVATYKFMLGCERVTYRPRLRAANLMDGIKNSSLHEHRLTAAAIARVLVSAHQEVDHVVALTPLVEASQSSGGFGTYD